MNIYTRKIRWKFILFLSAVLIALGSLFYTNKLIRQLKQEEKNKVELWAKATEQLIDLDITETDFGFLFEVIENNNTVPVILVNSDNEIISTRNLDPAKENNHDYLARKLKKMKKQNEAIEFSISDNRNNFIYYKDSILLSKLELFPFVQLGVIILFILVSYFAFSASRKAEQNQVWLGLSKETAHQLGTPTSSLAAWFELLRMKDLDEKILKEFEKDVTRLEKITERFSKIGSKPSLKTINLFNVITRAVNYIKSRSSENVRFNVSFSEEDELNLPLNAALFEWVIENICKNAIDAMNGKGIININVQDNVQVVYLDISDTGRGMNKLKFKTVFKPGYTTKERGWGLGLSLSKRIVEMYHGGKIFVNYSEINKGTGIRIVLKK
ncbi:MAG: HAMP domain-containing histidine kinase [Bacteroidetes bacterium]|nr:HAMP domain-containing histidine kinase [Bacteroidota bacterium]